uniref:Uncharacterized protein n=1 Tax=Graphocephala atropunctata TaxID=36148 RepID=A0A1B6LQ45_9HEMI
MASQSPSHPSRPRPLSTIDLPLPLAEEPRPETLRRKFSLGHGEGAELSRRLQQENLHRKEDVGRNSPEELTKKDSEDSNPPQDERTLLANLTEKDINHNGPSKETGVSRRCKRKVLKQTSFESISCDDNYFYDFFDRNGRPPSPPQATLDRPSENAASSDQHTEIVEENNNPRVVNRIERNSGADGRVKRNVNVRPRSWLTTTTTERVEDCRRVRRRQTDPCGKDFLSNYERALSSLLYQPYECRSENPSSSTIDDSDVGYWLGSPKRWKTRDRRSAGEFFRNDSSESSSSSLSSSSSSLGEFIRRKPWGDCKDPSTSSIRALLEKSGNAAESVDLNSELPRGPLGAPRTGWEWVGEGRAAQSQCGAGHGREMLVSVVEQETRGSQSNLLAVASDSVSVSCYRAVPATVSAVPVIPCSNVSSVRVVPTTRTFTSTEAQTDDVIVDTIRVPSGNPIREQRRRERRERRQQRRLASHLHPHQTPDPSLWPPLSEPMVDRLPDILNSHLPPPYSTLPMGLPPPPQHVHPPPPIPPPMPPPIPVSTVPGSPPPQAGGLRFPFAIVPAGRRRSRLSPHFTPEDEPKSCCGVAVSQTLSIRWFIILIFLVGICCAVVGTILGAMKATGREHLTVSLLMIGVGIVLVAVSGVAWRLTSQDAPSCRAMLGLGGDDAGGEPNRRFVPRLPPSYGRPHHPYAAMMYPEFQYRAPPPSYQASMQEYRLRLLLLDRHSGVAPGAAVSPPPTYRSQAGSLLRAPIGFRGRETHTPSQSEYSRPPSYRSRTSSRPDPASSHSREPSGSDPGQAVNVITVHPHIIKLAPSPPLPAKIAGKDSNLVTIVQTASEPTGPVIVTISGQQDSSSSHCHQSEMEILAHL